MTLAIRAERPRDVPAIRAVTGAAFRTQPHGDGSEPEIIDRLRRDGDLALSLVYADAARVIGHIAFSPVTISDGTTGWYGLGPVSIAPELHGQGFGSRLIEHGIAAMKARAARGLVVLGSPRFYARFGFVHDPKLAYPGPPAAYFQRLVLAGDAPAGIVRYARAFG